MKTDDLIDTLARDTHAAGRPGLGERVTAGLAIAFGAALVTAIALALSRDGVRADFIRHASDVAVKFGFSMLLAAVALPFAARLARPGGRIAIRFALAAALAVGAGMLVGFALMPGPATGGGILGYGFPTAFFVIPLIALPGGVMMFLWLRQQAPTRLRLAGALAGAVAGGVGAMGYAFVCPVDDMAFVSFWYMAAVLACLGLGALAGARFLRW